MPRGKTSKSLNKKTNTDDYRYLKEKRTNIPPGLIAGEGVVPKVSKAQYSYSPHLGPTLRFDQTGESDKLTELVEKAKRTPLSVAEASKLHTALQQYEPWLEWAGKRELPSFAVDPVALHIHERVSTKAILRVAAREDIQRDLFADPQHQYHEAVQFYQHDIDWANRLILGDSLQVMASLAKREGVAGKVQMIYIDPPYGIKFSTNFQPTTERTSANDSERGITREPEMIRAYRDTWQLGVHSYLNYLRQRLTIAKDLLADTGSVFVQIGDENLHHVKELLDEVFGKQNSVSIITVKKTAGLGKGEMPQVTDFILWYCRDATQFDKSTLFDRKAERDSAYRYIRSETGEIHLDTSNDAESRDALFRYQIALAAGRTPSCIFPIDAFGGTFEPTAGRSWSSNVSGMQRLMRAERLAKVGNTLNYIRFLADFSVNPVSNLWADTASGSGMDKVYVVQTSTKVVERCMLMATKPGDLVIDPTCGSGTTAYVAEQWGRRWITIDTSRVAIAIARQRLLTSKFDYYEFKDEARGVEGGFKYKTIPHVTLRSIAQNTNLDPIFAKHEPILDTKLAVCNAALKQVTNEVRAKCSAKLAAKQKTEGLKSITDADRRRWELPKNWEHWQVPFDTDEGWPKELQSAVTNYRKAWRAKMDEVNACILGNADQEELVDQPAKVPGIVRVSGPFTVEGVRPEELTLGNDWQIDGSANDGYAEVGSNLTDSHQQNLQAYLDQMVQLIRKDGLTFLNNKRRRFAQVESLYDAATGDVLHAEGAWEDSASADLLDVAIGFGPQYGPVTAFQVEELIHASKRHSDLVVAGFSFDADATALIQKQSHPKLRIHQAYIRPDVNPGMAGLLKETPDSQLFTVFGAPEIDLESEADGNWVVHLKGVEVYDPITNTISSTGADKVAAWFVDSDFDGRCFCITQAFFPNQKSWEKIAKALGSAANGDALVAFKGTRSIPFAAGPYKRVAVKVVDPRGNEVMAVRALEG